MNAHNYGRTHGPSAHSVSGNGQAIKSGHGANIFAHDAADGATFTQA